MAGHLAEHRAFYRPMLTGSCAFAMARTPNGVFGSFNRVTVRDLVGALDEATVNDVTTFFAGGASAVVYDWLIDGPDPLVPGELANRLLRLASVIPPTSPGTWHGDPGSRLTQRIQLLPPTTRDLLVERGLKVPMRDGVVLLADRWYPKAGATDLSTALIRVPYGRAGATASQMARPLAGRGFQVLVQSTRGTFGSGGRFDPFRCERADGLDTLEWVAEQHWFGTSMILVGGSYLGGVQWTVADVVPPQVEAVIPAARPPVRPGRPRSRRLPPPEVCPGRPTAGAPPARTRGSVTEIAVLSRSAVPRRPSGPGASAVHGGRGPGCGHRCPPCGRLRLRPEVTVAGAAALSGHRQACSAPGRGQPRGPVRSRGWCR